MTVPVSKSTARNGRRARAVITNPLVWIVGAAFAPYLVSRYGLRIEHIVIYALGGWGFLSILTSSRNVRLPGAPIALFFALGAFWIGLTTVLVNPPSRDLLSVVARLDHFLRPIAIALGVSAWAVKRDAATLRSDLRTAAVAVVVLLGANSFVSVLAGSVDVTGIVAPFRSSRVGDPTQLGLSAAFLDFGDQGRVTGIFGLPSDAGLAYSIGLFCWVYVARTTQGKSVSGYWYAWLIVVFTGGLLAVSKTFLLAGVPLFVIYWLWGGRVSSVLSAKLVLLLVIGLVIGNVLLADWVGFNTIGKWVSGVTSGESGVIEVGTAGRFGVDDSTVGSRFARLASTSALYTGKGFGTTGALDNGYFAFFLQGGILPVIGYVALLAWLMSVAVKTLRVGGEESRFLLAIVVYVIGAGIGSPVVSSVRASTLVWVIVVLLLAVVRTSKGVSNARPMSEHALASRPAGHSTSRPGVGRRRSPPP